MKTTDISTAIYENFASTYKNAAPFVDSGPLWDFAIKTIEDPITMSCIVFANDLGVPPVKSLLIIYERKMKPEDDFNLKNQESQWLGSLMGFVFKYVLDYKKQKERCTVNLLGVKTATRFLDGSIVEFE